jgi:hypothetical protein
VHLGKKTMTSPVLMTVARYRMGLVLVGVGSLGSFVTAGVQLQKSLPRPAVYIRSENHGVGQRGNTSEDPKLELLFCNMGGGQLHIKSFVLFQKGKAVSSLESLLPDPDYIVSSESTGLLGDQLTPRTYRKRSQNVYLTVRPSDEQFKSKNTAWVKKVEERLCGVEFHVTHSFFPWCTWPTSITRVLLVKS